MSRQPILIRHEHGQRNVYKNGEFIAAIVDHRERNKADLHSTARDNWGVAFGTL